MAYCGPRGIPLSVFLGRVVGPGEPTWLPEDAQVAVDWMTYEARRCKGCGVHPDDVAEGKFHAHLDECRGCLARKRASEAPDAQQHPTMFAVALPWSAKDCPRCNPADG